MSAAASSDTPGSVGVIITAGGSSTRFGTNKLAERLGDRSVLFRSVAAFAQHPRISDVVVAVPATPDAALAGVIDEIRASSLAPRVRFVAAAGASRAHTVATALRELRTDFAAVHDGARPLVSAELIDRVLAAAAEHGAAAPAMPVTSTIKLAGTSLPSAVERTVPRNTLWAMQTPQVMRREVLLDAFARCPIPLERVTDDAQLLELIGVRVMLVAGEERNLKLTTRLDLELALLLISKPLEGVTP